MKPSGHVNFHRTGKIFLFVILVLFAAAACKKKVSEQDASISKYRKGELIVQAKKGSKVTVEQLRHEFWFGCAIPNNFVGGMSESNLKQFKEHFLMNFNCAVPENSREKLLLISGKSSLFI